MLAKLFGLFLVRLISHEYKDPMSKSASKNLFISFFFKVQRYYKVLFL